MIALVNFVSESIVSGKHNLNTFEKKWGANCKPYSKSGSTKNWADKTIKKYQERHNP